MYIRNRISADDDDNINTVLQPMMPGMIYYVTSWMITLQTHLPRLTITFN